MRPAMNRIFLAILALFAGIAAQVAPAEARMRGNTEIGSVVTQRAAVRAAAAVEVAAVHAAAPEALRRDAPLPLRHAPGSAVAVPTVRLGPDRALE